MYKEQKLSCVCVGLWITMCQCVCVCVGGVCESVCQCVFGCVCVCVCVNLAPWHGPCQGARSPYNQSAPQRVIRQLHQGQRSAGGQEKCLKTRGKWLREKMAADHNTWWQLCLDGTHTLDIKEGSGEKHPQPWLPATSTPCIHAPSCNRTCRSRIGLLSHWRIHR